MISLILRAFLVKNSEAFFVKAKLTSVCPSQPHCKIWNFSHHSQPWQGSHLIYSESQPCSWLLLHLPGVFGSHWVASFCSLFLRNRSELPDFWSSSKNGKARLKREIQTNTLTHTKGLLFVCVYMCLSNQLLVVPTEFLAMFCRGGRSGGLWGKDSWCPQGQKSLCPTRLWACFPPLGKGFPSYSHAFLFPHVVTKLPPPQNPTGIISAIAWHS